MSLDDLFQNLRESADASTWSRAVETTRSSRVMLESEEPDEIVLIVHPGRSGAPAQRVARPFRVRLFPKDSDWSCQCDEGDPCVHAAAAAIVYRQSKLRGQPLPRKEGGKAGHVGYRLSRSPQGLVLERVSVQETGETAFKVSLSSLETGRASGPSLEATGADRRLETIVGSHFGQPMPRNVMARVVDALSNCADVRLDGVSVKTTSSRSLPHGRIADHPEGFKLFLEQDPAIVEVFPGGVVLLEPGVLQAVGESPLTGREIEDLRRGRVFPREDATYLATELVPSLASRIPFEVRSRRLPRLGGKAPVRVVVETEAKGDSLFVLPLLVYGDPPIARVDSGRLVPLGDVVPVRDVEEERALCRRLHAELGLEPGRKLERRGAQALALAEALARWKGDVQGTGRERFFRAPPLQAHLGVSGDDLDLRFTSTLPAGGLHGEKETRVADPRAVISAWMSGESMVSLQGGGLAPLPADWLARFGPRIADLLAAKEACRGELPRAVLPDLARLCLELDAPPPPGFERLRALVDSALSSEEGGPAPSAAGEEPQTAQGSLLPEPGLPDDLRATLRPYQHEGLRWLSFLREAGLGALLADDMGLGKTVQTLASLRGRTLVVAPASVVHNWADEIARFRPALSVCVYHGPGRSLDQGADVTITTYAILRLDVEELSSIGWDTVVLDESQAIKNQDSQVSRAAFRLRAEHRIALTGTPVENRLEDLWSQMHFTNPGLLGGLGDFESRYVKPIREGEVGVAARLRSRIKPFVLRRTKAAVAPELPERTDIVLRCALTEPERLLYDSMQAAAREEVVGRLAAGGSVLEALEALLRMRQAACHPGLVPGQTAKTSAKVELLMETLQEALSEGHKALIFSQWTSLLDLVEPHLLAAKIPFTRLDGSTRDRGGVVRGFQDEGGPPVMLVSLKAGGTGLNLTAADHVFLLDPWWNPAVEDQAAGRAHRIGQLRPVMVHRLVAEETVEERILGLQEHKRALFEAALGEAEGGAGLTRDDLLALLD